MMTRSTLATTRSAGCWTFFTLWSSPRHRCRVPPIRGPGLQKTIPHRASNRFSRTMAGRSAGASGTPRQAEPFRHDPPGNRRRAGRTRSPTLDDHCDRDLRRRIGLPGCEADEPRVRRLLTAELCGAGLAGRTDVTYAVHG